MVVNISKRVNCERFETRSVTARGLTREGFCKVTFEYCMKWKRHKSSTYTPNPTQKYFRNTDGRSNWQTRDNSDPVKGSTRDLLDIIDDEEAARAVVDTGDCGEELLQVADQESPEPSDLQCPSEHSFDNDSTMSGPSFPHMTRGLCSGCHNLYQTAKKKKRPLKNKLYNDPTSLSCDQWVMQKRRSTRRPHGMKSTVWTHDVMVRVSESFYKKRNKGEWDQPTCSRPHSFLKRNLKKSMVAIKRGRRTAEKRRRKRLKDVAQDGSLTKQPRLDDTGDCGEELLQVSTEPSDLQCPSERSFDNDSTMSGPSFPNMMQEGPLLGLCSGCHKLYQTAKNKKKFRPLKNKLLDPTSLSCDQWVMQKRRSTRRPHGMKSTVWDHHVMVRVSESFCKKQNKGEWDQPTCSRPHRFLKRNLKCMVGIKRGRTAQDGSLTKQPRVDDSGIASLDHTLDLSNISSYSNPVCSEVAGSNDKCSEVISATSVNVNGTGQLKVSPPKRSAAKKRARFNELFAQIFHKKSSIVRL